MENIAESVNLTGVFIVIGITVFYQCYNQIKELKNEIVILKNETELLKNECNDTLIELKDRKNDFYTQVISMFSTINNTVVKFQNTLYEYSLMNHEDNNTSLLNISKLNLDFGETREQLELLQSTFILLSSTNIQQVLAAIYILENSGQENTLNVLEKKYNDKSLDERTKTTLKNAITNLSNQLHRHVSPESKQ